MSRDTETRRQRVINVVAATLLIVSAMSGFLAPTGAGAVMPVTAASSVDLTTYTESDPSGSITNVENTSYDLSSMSQGDNGALYKTEGIEYDDTVTFEQAINVSSTGGDWWWGVGTDGGFDSIATPRNGEGSFAGIGVNGNGEFQMYADGDFVSGTYSYSTGETYYTQTTINQTDETVTVELYTDSEMTNQVWSNSESIPGTLTWDTIYAGLSRGAGSGTISASLSNGSLETTDTSTPSSELNLSTFQSSSHPDLTVGEEYYTTEYFPSSESATVRKKVDVNPTDNQTLKFKFEGQGSQIHMGWGTQNGTSVADINNGGDFAGFKTIDGEFQVMSFADEASDSWSYQSDKEYWVTVKLVPSREEIVAEVYTDSDRTNLAWDANASIPGTNSYNWLYPFASRGAGDSTGTAQVNGFQYSSNAVEGAGHSTEDLTSYNETDSSDILAVDPTKAETTSSMTDADEVSVSTPVSSPVGETHFNLTIHSSDQGAAYFGYSNPNVTTYNDATNFTGLRIKGTTLSVRGDSTWSTVAELTSGETYWIDREYTSDGDVTVTVYDTEYEETQIAKTTVSYNTSVDYEAEHALLSEGYSDTDHSIDLSVTDYGHGGSTATDEDIKGHVENQNGQPISNATVHLYYSTLPTATEARDQLDSISDPTPTTFADHLDSDFSVMDESDGLATKKDFVPAIYSPEELGTAPWVDNADLGDPHWRQVPQDESFTVTIADTRDGVDKGVLSGEYANQMYGHPYKRDDGTVTFQRLSASGEPLGDPIEFDLNKKAGGGLGDPSSMQYAEVPADALQPGFYQLSAKVEGEKKASYPIRVGSPEAAVDQYLETSEGTLTNQADQAKRALSDGELVHKTVVTNSDGEWNATVPSNAKVVQVQAMKAPGVDVPPEDLTRDNVTAAYASAESAPNASVYFPSRVRRVSLPADDVSIMLVESRFPPTADMSQLQDRLEELRSMLNNLTLADLRPGPLNEGAEQARSELAATWSELRGILMQFEPARERYLEMSDRDEVPTADELDEDELRTAISIADTAITSTQSTAEVEETGELVTDDGTISRNWEVSGIDLSEANVSVIAHYSNGTRTTVPSEYVTVDDGAVTDTVRLEEFPYGEDDPAQVSFRLDVAGPSDSIGEDASEYATDETVVKNPTYNGEVPDIASIELSSIRPGPNDDVSLTVHEERESSFRQLVDATVYAPDGSTVPTGEITDGDTVDFQTDGQGVYRVEYTVQNRDGKNFTDTISVRAAEADQDLEPGLYAHSGPMGNIALASDGLSGGSVDITDSGRVEAIAQLPEDSDTPNEVQVYTSGLSTGPETPVEVRLVEGEDRQGVDQHTYVRIHGKRISDDALVYRNGDEPITRDGETRYGEVNVDADGTSIRTWTNENGVVETTVNNDPGWLDRQQYRIDIWTAGTDLPLLSFVPDLPAEPVLPGLTLTAAAGGAVVASRRRAR